MAIQEPRPKIVINGFLGQQVRIPATKLTPLPWADKLITYARDENPAAEVLRLRDENMALRAEIEHLKGAA
jgi:hypothetical protein